jgi:hypothetical protein
VSGGFAVFLDFCGTVEHLIDGQWARRLVRFAGRDHKGFRAGGPALHSKGYVWEFCGHLRFFFAFFGVLFGIRFHGIRYWKFCFLWVDWVIFAHNKATRGRRPRGV